MKHNINTIAMNKTSYDSTYIGVLSYHVIQLKEEGNYIGHVVTEKGTVNSVTINVSDDHKNIQSNIDFYNFSDGSKTDKNNLKYELKTDGYLVLMNSQRDDKLRMKIEKIGKTKGGSLFSDTKSIIEGQLYACTLLRPGNYEVSYNNKKAGNIVVVYPTASVNKELLNEGVRIKVGKNGLEEKEIKALPMQGLVFDFEAPGTIKVELLKEEKSRGLVYDKVKPIKMKKKKMAKKTYRWENPKYAHSSK